MKVITDSAADLTTVEIRSLGITVAPLYINFPDGSVSATDISADAFYSRLEALAPRVPTTSQPSQGTFTGIFSELVKAGEELLAVHISSGLSGTYEASLLASRQITQVPVSVVDSLTLSGGQRFQVLAAAAAARAGWALNQVRDTLKRIQQHTEVVYTLDTLEYLARGGRIGRVEALAGGLLRIKPVINVNRTDGRYSTVTKARTLQRAETAIVDHLVRLYGDTPVWVSIMHGRFTEHAEELAAKLTARLQCARVEILRISPVLGVHTGPAIVGAAVVPVSLMQEAGCTV